MATSIISPNQIETKKGKYNNKEYSPSSNSPSQNESLLQEMEPNSSESNTKSMLNPKFRGMVRSDTVEALEREDDETTLEPEPLPVLLPPEEEEKIDEDKTDENKTDSSPSIKSADVKTDDKSSKSKSKSKKKLVLQMILIYPKRIQLINIIEK